MHREPMPRDIVRVPGSDAPERVMSVDDHTLTLAPLRGDETRTIERPAREHIALVGVAAPARKRRAEPALDAAKHMAQVIDSPECVELTDRCLRIMYGAALPVADSATVAHTHGVVSVQDAAQILQDPGAEISCGYTPEPIPVTPDLVEQLSDAAALGFDISEVGPLTYGSGGVDPSDLF